MASDQSTPPTQSPGDIDARVAALASAFEQRAPLVIREAPQTVKRRTVYWIIGGLCALVIGSAEAAILLYNPAPKTATASVATTSVLDTDPCAQRLTTILAAVDAYAAARGTLPPNLESLHPEFLAFPPIDPQTNAPYGYQVADEGVTLTCPSAASDG
jgi:hypothetical protein